MSDVTPDAPKKTTISITVDGRIHEAKPGQLVIDACEDAGTYVPRFCYHPRMNPVGMCRQCLVEVEGPRGPMMVVSCMTPVADKQVVHTDTPTVKKAQEGVLEFLLANHPLDCPVCDKGGECPLQDQAFSHGPGESRFVEEKRHYEKPIAISDLVYLDRERCILCDRCTRFADEVAGDPLIQFTQRGGNTQVLTFPNEPFSSYFSGNTVQICPVGALTATPYRFKARPWDLDQTESTCTSCSVGCRVMVQSSRDELLRYQGVDSDPVNWGWLCDRGRFDFEAVNSGDRLGSPAVRKNGELIESSWAEALDAAAAAITAARSAGKKVAIIGGARLANEDALAWAKLASDVIDTPHVDCQLGDGLPANVVLGLPRATIDEACRATTLILLGPDLKEELPVLYLRVRDAAEKRKIRILEISPTATGLTKYAWTSVRHAPGSQAATIRSVVAGAAVAEQLAKGNVVVIAGRSNLAESESHAVDALVAVRELVPAATFLPALRRGNVMGALSAGLRPGVGGFDATGILEAAASGEIGCLVLLGSDPISDFPDADLARRGLDGADAIVAVDCFVTKSSDRAAVILAAATYGERAGTTTNLEGRVTRLSQKVTPTGLAHPDWIIAADLADRLGAEIASSLDELSAELATSVGAFAPVTVSALAADRNGVLLTATTSATAGVGSTPNAANSYDFRLVVARKLYDDAVSVAKSPSLAPLTAGPEIRLNPIDVDRLGATDARHVKVSTSRTSMSLKVVADVAVPKGVALVAFNRSLPDGTSIGELISAGTVVTDVRVENL